MIGGTLSRTIITTHLALAAGLLAASVAFAAEGRMYKGYETPPFEVVRADGAVEIRRYLPHLVAEVSVEGTRQGAVGRGFRMLAGYIFGKNSDGAKLAMTAPVTQFADGLEGSRRWHVQFMLPASQDPDTVPRPDNDAIRFVETPPNLQAVIRFSGFWTDRRLAEKARQLQAWLDAQGLKAVGPPRYYFYDDPFTLPFNRRNEVALVLG